MTVDFDSRVEYFVKELTVMKRFHEVSTFGKSVNEPKYTIERGRKFVKILDSYRSVYCFVSISDNQTKKLGHVKRGDILKPASYRGPAKHARGNIFNDNPIQFCGPYGVAYLK